jgi:hypothetical protein
MERMALSRLALCSVLSMGFVRAHNSDVLDIRGVITEPGPGVDLGVAGARSRYLSSEPTRHTQQSVRPSPPLPPTGTAHFNFIRRTLARTTSR